MSRSSQLTSAIRTYATTTSTPRQPVPPMPEVETFSGTSKPKEYYERPQRDLPPLQVRSRLFKATVPSDLRAKRKWPGILVASILGVSAWGAFYLYAANQERLSSSVVKQIMNTVGENEELRETLGDAIRFEPVWWLNGAARLEPFDETFHDTNVLLLVTRRVNRLMVVAAADYSLLRNLANLINSTGIMLEVKTDEFDTSTLYAHVRNKLFPLMF